MSGTIGQPEALTCLTGVIAVLVVVAALVGCSRSRKTACPSCGKDILGGSAYCNHCGASVTGDGELP